PHSDAGGDAYYIGDAYEPAKCAHEWEIKDNLRRPYLEYIKRISKHFPHLEYLAHWMEVTCAPPKWKFIQKCESNRESRARRCHVCVLNYDGDGSLSSKTHESTVGLGAALMNDPSDGGKAPVRLIIVEDLSRDVVELLGARYDIDPLFFLSHIGDYLFHNTRDRWVELPDLNVVARQRPYFNVSYLRARYFKSQLEFAEAERQTGMWNVLRRLDSDRSSKRLSNGLLDEKDACVTLTRAKTSVWVKPRSSTEPVIAIVLVDPTVEVGYPQWGGYRPFAPTPSMHDETAAEGPPRTSLFHDTVYWSSKMTKDELDIMRADTKFTVAIPILRLVLADWMTVLKYMATMLNKLEWEFERPHFWESPGDIDGLLKKLSPWRRNVPLYNGMISDAIDRIFGHNARPEDRNANASVPSPDLGILSLLQDFRSIQQQMAESQKRIDTYQNIVTASVNIEESRRAVQQNQQIGRLTWIASLFIPLNATSSFLSISPDFSAAIQTIRLFFAIGIPLTIIAM
ncbi:hypothetical protein BAUCODRAFT_44556, partial [Baudoinia panamericana UAMH 10762]